MTTKVHLIKVARDTRMWRKGQKVWVKFHTGDTAHCVRGRYRGRGRYVSAWIHEKDFSGIQEIEVDKAFAERHGLWVDTSADDPVGPRDENGGAT